MVVVTEPNGDLRLCIDPRDLKNVRSHFQMPTFGDISSKLSGDKLFSTLDTQNGFCHIKISEESSRLYTFFTPSYCRHLSSYELCCASEIFQQKIMQIFEGIDGVEVYVDDSLGRQQKST